MANRILKIIVDCDLNHEMSEKGNKLDYDFSLNESAFKIPKIGIEIKNLLVDLSYVNLEIDFEKVKIKYNEPLRMLVNKKEKNYLLTVLYTDVDDLDEIFLSDYHLEIEEYRAYQEMYENTEKECKSRLEVIENNSISLSLTMSNVYIQQIDTSKKEVVINIGESKKDFEQYILKEDSPITYHRFSQGGNTEESFFQKVIVIKVTLKKD